MSGESRGVAMPRSFLVSRQPLEATSRALHVQESHDVYEMPHNIVEMMNRNVGTNHQPSPRRPPEGSRDSEHHRPMRAGTPSPSPPFDRCDVIANCFRNILASGPTDERTNTSLWSQILAARWSTELPGRRMSPSPGYRISNDSSTDARPPSIHGTRVVSQSDDFRRQMDRSSNSADSAGVISDNKLQVVPTSRTSTRSAPWRPFVDEDDVQVSGMKSAPIRCRADVASSNCLQETTRVDDAKCGSSRRAAGGLFLRRENQNGDRMERKLVPPGGLMTKQQNHMRTVPDNSNHGVTEMHEPKTGKPAVDNCAGELRPAAPQQNNSGDLHGDRRELFQGHHQDIHFNSHAPHSPHMFRPAWHDIISESYHVRRSHNFLPTYAPWRQRLSSSVDASPSPSSMSSSPSPNNQNKQLAIAGLLLSPGFTENPSTFNGISTCSSVSSSSSSSRCSVGRSHPTPFCAAVAAATEKSPLTCTYCDKVYTSAGALKMHIRTHTLPCRCPHCGKAFSRLWLLRGHLRTHTGERPFHCPDPNCRRAFADRSNLRAHLRTHAIADTGCGGDGRTTGNRPRRYECTVCGKTFSRMSLLARHEMNAGCRRAGTERELHGNSDVIKFA